MHIKIENDQNETEAVLCIERGMMARVLLYKSEHLRTLINIAQTIGAHGILVTPTSPEDQQTLEAMGFTLTPEPQHGKVFK